MKGSVGLVGVLLVALGQVGGYTYQWVTLGHIPIVMCTQGGAGERWAAQGPWGEGGMHSTCASPEGM